MTKKNVDEAKARAALEEKASKMNPEDAAKILDREQEMHEKIKDVPGKLRKLVNQVKLLFEMIADYFKGEYKEIPWTTIAMSAAALLYFLSPIDLIPDFIPVVGYVDDAAVVALAVAAIQEDLKAYCRHKQYEPEQYF